MAILSVEKLEEVVLEGLGRVFNGPGTAGKEAFMPNLTLRDKLIIRICHAHMRNETDKDAEQANPGNIQLRR